MPLLKYATSRAAAARQQGSAAQWFVHAGLCSPKIPAITCLPGLLSSPEELLRRVLFSRTQQLQSGLLDFSFPLSADDDRSQTSSVSAEMEQGSCTPPSEGAGHYSFGLSPKQITFIIAPLIAFTPFFVLFGIPAIWNTIGSLLGSYLQRKTDGRRTQILKAIEEDERIYLKKYGDKSDGSKDDWSGIVGFFHPFCNAGGGGERVLWAAIRAVQQRWPKARIVVYTGDHEVNKDQILSRVESRFNIHLHQPTIQFLYLSQRRWVLASTWPHFTLLGQSFGSILLAWDAFSLVVPDIFVDTMGYAFSLGLSKWLFNKVPSGAYVHYPTISTDMLESLDPSSPLGSQGVNAGQGVGLRGFVKRYYWRSFAWLYSKMGSTVDVVMTNSTWTQAHVTALWGPGRRDAQKNEPIAVVYPPCAVEELEEAVEVSAASEAKRGKLLLYIAQFRPEKNHQLILQAFSEFVKTGSEAAKDSKMILVGSVRDDADSKRVYKLRLLIRELRIQDQVEFHLDAPWPNILEWLQKASVGVNGMWNEHFGIGVVEYQASGLISVVHNSGGPKLDIVTEVDGEPTGFHAASASEFAKGFEQALSLPDPLAMRLRARKSAKRFGEVEFARKWIEQMERLVALTNKR